VPGQVLIAPNEAKLEGPSIFLAGPIQGAARWQDAAIEEIRKLDQDVHITSPRRSVFQDKGFVYEEQVDWETKYLHRAADTGAILFWLANEFEHVCFRAYAQTTRWELAEWIANYVWWKTLDGRPRIKIALGIDSKFSGARYVWHRLKKDAPELPIYETLQGTCLRAVEDARRR